MAEVHWPTPPGPPFTRGGKEKRLLRIAVGHKRNAQPGAASAIHFRPAPHRHGPSLAQATLIVIAAGLLWRTVRYALAFPLWSDEAYVGINLLTRDLAGLARPLEYFQIAPPGFLCAEWLAIHLFGTSERALRLVPSLAGVASLLFFWRFCGAVTSRRTALLAVAAMAASFYPVRHSTEVKPYAIDLLVSLLLITTGWAAARDIRSCRAWVALIAASSVGVWYSYTALFPAAGVAVFLAARLVHERSSRLWGRWLLYVLLTALNWGIVFAAFGHPQASAASAVSAKGDTWNNAYPPLAEPWRLPWRVLDVHTGNILAYPYGGNNFGSTLTTIVVIAGCVRMYRRRVRRPLLFLLPSPLAVAILAAALHRYPYGTSTRVTLYMAPTFCLLIGEGIMGFLQLRRWTRRGPLVVGGVLGTTALLCIASNVISPYKAYDDILHRSLVRWLVARTAPEDEWIVFNGARRPPAVKGVMVMPWLQRVAEARFYLLNEARVPLRWELDPQTIAPRVGGKVWLIVQNHGDPGYFPAARLASYERTLAERLGPARTKACFHLPRGETWSITCLSPIRRYRKSE